MSTHRILGLEKTRINLFEGRAGFETSLSKGNLRVINELKTVKASMIIRSQEVNAVGKGFSEVNRAYLLTDALSRLNVRSEGRRKNYAVMVQEDRLP